MALDVQVATEDVDVELEIQLIQNGFAIMFYREREIRLAMYFSTCVNGGGYP